MEQSKSWQVFLFHKYIRKERAECEHVNWNIFPFVTSAKCKCAIRAYNIGISRFESCKNACVKWETRTRNYCAEHLQIFGQTLYSPACGARSNLRFGCFHFCFSFFFCYFYYLSWLRIYGSKVELFSRGHPEFSQPNVLICSSNWFYLLFDFGHTPFFWGFSMLVFTVGCTSVCIHWLLHHHQLNACLFNTRKSHLLAAKKSCAKRKRRENLDSRSNAKWCNFQRRIAMFSQFVSQLIIRCT